MSRNVYAPYHPWRHGYEREVVRKLAAVLVWAVIALGYLGLFGSYIKTRTAEVTIVQDSGEPGGGEEISGIGFGIKGGRPVFFHSRFMQSSY